MAHQKQSEGGLIYLAYDPALIGQDAAELDLIGPLSGMDGIVTVLNQQVKKVTGQEGTFTTTSRVAKRIYDRVQESYDGQYDPGQDKYSGYRRSFFRPEELLEMARAFGAEIP